MPTKIIYTDTVGTGIQVTLLATEDLYVKRGVLVGSTENEAVALTTDDHEVHIDGEVYGDYMGILNNDSLSRGNIIVVGASGVVDAGFHSGIYLSGGEHSITNFGEIRGSSGITMYTTSTDGGMSTIVNHGTIYGDHTGIGRQNSDVREGLKVVNYGTIEGGTFSYNYSAGQSKETIINKGLMVGDVMLGDLGDKYDGREGRVDGIVDGGSGNDGLYGGVADDTLLGGDNNDALYGGAGADSLDGGSGTDRTSYATAKSGVTASLAKPTLNTGDASGDKYSSIENLVGSRFADKLYGNSGANEISGGEGDDLIDGSTGSDTFIGGEGKDLFRFSTTPNASTNLDTIDDFVVADDTIQLDQDVFAALALGTLASGAFSANSSGVAQDSSDRIIYEFDTGKVFYDTDGTGSAAAKQFALLDIGLALTAKDFVIV